MAVQPSQTRIVNKALALLGSTTRITHIEDGTGPAKTALALFDEARDGTTADHPWNFAIKRAALAADSAAPLFEFDRAFTLPADCLRWLPPAKGDDHYFDGVEEDGKILTDEEAPLYIRYIRRVEDPGKWSQGFRHALACRLAMEMAEPITQQTKMSMKMEKLYDAALRKAKRQDGLASGRRSRKASSRSTWLEARD